MIGRYGGCFEEDIRWFMCDRAYHITGFGCTGEVCTNSQGEKGQCAVPKRLENSGKVSVRIIHGLTLVIKNSYTYCKNLLALEAKYYYACSQGKGWQELTIARSRPPLIRKAIKEHSMLQISHTTVTIRACYGTCKHQHKYFSNSQLPTSMTLISPSLYRKTIARNQTYRIQ